MAHEAQPPDSAPPRGWLPPVPPGSSPPPVPPAPAPAPTAWGQPTPPPAAPAPPGWGPPWATSLYYSYREPGNDSGVAGFCMSLGAVILLIITFGLAAFLALPLAVAGVILSVRGRRRFTRGETTQHGGLARAGFWIGLFAILASLGATAGWVLAIVNGHAFDTSSPVPNHQTPAVIRPP